VSPTSEGPCVDIVDSGAGLESCIESPNRLCNSFAHNFDLMLLLLHRHGNGSGNGSVGVWSEVLAEELFQHESISGACERDQ
jgi:hypothetical protein